MKSTTSAATTQPRPPTTGVGKTRAPGTAGAAAGKGDAEVLEKQVAELSSNN